MCYVYSIVVESEATIKVLKADTEDSSQPLIKLHLGVCAKELQLLMRLHVTPNVFCGFWVFKNRSTLLAGYDAFRCFSSPNHLDDLKGFQSIKPI